MRLCLLFTAFLALLPRASAAAGAPVKIIFDTDMAEDVDDVGALAALHALADLGEAEILAVGVSSRNEHAGPCIDAINTWYGRASIPIGYQRALHAGFPAASRRLTPSKYAEAVARAFPHRLARSSDAPDAALLYRRVLAAQPDKSVVIVSVGFLSNLKALLDSPADAVPWTGEELVRRKVRLWVCMGGKFPGGRFARGEGEYNLRVDPQASLRALGGWPTPVVFSGFEIGAKVFTGKRLGTAPETNPVRLAYLRFNGLDNRESWDQTAVVYAVRGAAAYWNESEPGQCVMRTRGDAGYNEWIPAQSGKHRYLIEKMPAVDVARMIEELMTRAPKSLKSAATYYVAQAGSDDNPGTQAAPFATLARAQAAASPGDTVLIRGGLYAYVGSDSAVGVTFDKSGTPSRRIHYWAYPGEKPIFDFSGMNAPARLYGFRVTASWLHFRGLELRGVQQILTKVNESWCIRVENGSHNIFEQLDLHHNEGPGLFIQAGSDNHVVNVDSHDNYDLDRGGENADGFGCHATGEGNVFSGCRAWSNSDDGFDFINSPGACTVERSWAFRNGYQPGTPVAAGNGAGFKAGGFGLNRSRFPATIPRHVVRFNVAWGNRRQGFYANHHPGGIDWVSNTAFDNPMNFDMLADVGSAAHQLRNNLAAAPGAALANGTKNEIDDAGNSWSVPGITVSNADFVSVSDAQATSARMLDGNLPRLDFLRLAPGSDLIDRGIDVGFPYAGAAPDLGAFEYEGRSAEAPGARRPVESHRVRRDAALAGTRRELVEARRE